MCRRAVLAEERWHICSLKSQLQPGNPFQLQSQSSASHVTDRRLLYVPVCIWVLFCRARPGSYSCVPSQRAGLFTDSHTLILKHGRAINSVAAALICSLRGDCIRTMPSSGCSREEREEREERRGGKQKTTNHRRHPAGVEVETETLLLTDDNTAEARRRRASYLTSRPPDGTQTPEASTSPSLRSSCRWICNMSVCHRFNQSNTNTWLIWTSLHSDSSRFLFRWAEAKIINKLSEPGAEAQHTLKAQKSKSSY